LTRPSRADRAPAPSLVGIITESDIFRVLIAWFNEEQAAEAA
jgi:CBS domain-containing protein